MTTISAPRKPAVGHDADPVVEVSLGTDSPVASLTLPLLAATRAAALACLPWVGRDQPKAADGAAVAAMRASLAQLPGRATVVIGEGEKDAAPMLFAGEELGTGNGPDCELAVDPLEGTRLCARGQEGAVAVLAAGPPGSLWDTPGWYMEKLVVPAAAAGAVAIDRPLSENLAALADALDKPVPALLVAVQDRPRHAELVASIRRLGAGVVLFGDGDVMTSLRVLMPEGDLDALLGIGGAPEGVITACAARLLGGGMQGRLAPQSPEERARLEAAGISVGDVMTLPDLVSDDDCVFVATGVTGSALLGRPQPIGTAWRTCSLVAAAGHPRLLVESLTTAP